MKSDTTRNYWRSRGELHQTPAYQQEVSSEFQDELDTSTPEGTSRRGFLGWVGASLAASGLSGCDIIRRPEERILPYSSAAEEILPGIPQYYATATSVGGEAIGLLVESHEGRPTKLEGNPEHRSNLGALNNIHQSLVLDLYDPQRLRQASVKGRSVHSSDASIALAAAGKTAGSISVIAESIPSVQVDRLAQALKAKGAQWYTYESLSDDNERAAMKALFNDALRPRYSFSQTKVVLSLDSDFLGTEGPSVAYASEWADTRRLNGIDPKKATLSRLYAVEARYSLTGSNADHRVRASHAEIEAFAFAVAKAVGVSGVGSTKVKLSDHQSKAAASVAKDLKANRGTSLILAGRNQPSVVHALAALMNQELGALGTLVNYYPDARRSADALGDMEGISALGKSLNAGKVDTLIILGGNPAYSAPADLKFAEAIKKAKQVIYLADQANETTAALDPQKTIVIPQAHFLETWGDVVAIDGQVSIQQPLIQSLHQGAMSALELLATFLGEDETKGYKIVRAHWKGKAGALGFHKRWRRWLHAGVVENEFSTFKASNKNASGLGGLKSSAMSAPVMGKLDVLFFAGHNSFDGRFANNSWLQELPDPMTKITWDNAALLSPKTAKALEITDEDMVTVAVNGASIETVAWIMPGQADDTVVLNLGYGRNFDNYLEYHQGPYNEKSTTGVDVNPLRSTSSAFAIGGASVAKTGATYPVAAVQRHDNSRQYSIEGFETTSRPDLVREASLDDYAKTPGFAKAGIIEHGKAFPNKDKFSVLHPPEKSIFGDFDYSKGLQWGMVIDLNTCTGCNACMVACVSENSISMVGKDQVRRGREMHWIRMDRYFVGSEEEPEIVHQPLACQQCETAPCENVCPVAATVHSPEGLNDMVYNRCIGTRYCANNCPFKVRRFNFYNYAKGQDELFHMQRNPNVTVRFRGVMEKCTYCVQRINKGKRRAALNADVSQQIIDNITPACAQGCPTKAITFGDINNPKSPVAKLKKAERDYMLLSELNVQSRTSFLAKIRNPNSEFPTASAPRSEDGTQAG